MINKSLFSSASDNWSTPQDFYDLLNREFNFTLDPCASDDNHKTERYLTEKDDGLKQEWHGSVYCNPPYSQIKEWVKKAYEESKKDYCDRVVLLVPARPDTRYWYNYVSQAYEVRFLKGRLKFGNSVNSAPFPSAVIVFDKKGNYIDPTFRFWDWKNP
jgi:site-specific DNA-methyltransferase (adenine-specific)